MALPDAGPTTPPTDPTREPREPDYGKSAEGPAARLIHDCIYDARNNSARKDRDRFDLHNLIFDRGGDSQWRVWDKSTGRYVERGYDPERGGLPAWVPRPVTNVFSNKIQAIVSLLNQSEPAREFSPSTGDDEDISTAEVAEDAVPVLLDEIRYADDIKPRVTQLITLTDKVYLVPFYDPDPKYGTELIPDYQCANCGLTGISPEEAEDEQGNALPCPECGTPLEYAMDGQGELQGQQAPIGKLCCEVLSSFEGSLPRAARVADAMQVEWFLSHTRMSPSDIVRRWPNAAKLELTKQRASGKTGGDGLSRNFADQMATLSAPSRAQEIGGAGGDGQTDPVVYRLQHDPIVTKDYFFPDGLMVTMCEDHILEAGPLTTTDSSGRPVKNLVIVQYQSQPGTVFGKPPADDLLPLQEMRNTIESLSMLILMHDAAPTMFIPLSVSLENEPTGVPGQTVWYRSMVAGDRPSMERGQDVPASVFKQLEIIDDKMDEISRLNSVLQGARPTGDPTLGEVEILQERGMSAFKPVLDKLVAAEKQLIRLLLWIARESAWAPRFRQVMGDNGEWDLKQFTGADLGGVIDIRIDPSTAWPKSPVMQRMMLKEAFAMGLFPPPVQDPELAQKILRMLNLATLKPSLDLDRKQVGRKIGRWKAATDPSAITPPDPVTENLPIHFVLLSNFLKHEEYELLTFHNPAVATAMKQHVAGIGQMIAQQAAAQQAAQNPAPPDDRKPTEKGDTSALQGAVKSGALTPGGPAAPEDPMQALMQTGALQPAGGEPPGQSLDQLVAARAMTPLPTGTPADTVM